jgi:DNA-binding NarL/FixJ family response regulator
MTRPRVLVADDHPGFIKAIRRLLAQNDFEVVGSVEDSAQLLGEATRLQPDVILLDLFMPDMNGLDACRQLSRVLQRTRIIVLTAEKDADIRQVALAAGAFAFVDKQALGAELLPAVRAACGDRPI